MSIISYAQNFEDVILWRALKHIERGFYIDIGAQDPVIDSVSLAFYEQGWRGVHVEPNSDYADKLRKARPEEQVIEFAISREAAEIAFYEIDDTGLSTGKMDIALRHQAEGLAVRRVVKQCQPLSVILDAYRDREVHWLKIDVEGMEDQVIDSWPPSAVRPWVVVVESTKPNSPEQNYMSWEPKLLKLGYEFVYFDGLNRFYVSADHPEVKDTFGPGPNFFDDFVLSGTASAPFSQKMNAEAASLRMQLNEVQSAKDGLNALLAQMQETKAAMQAQIAQAQGANARLEARLSEQQRARDVLEAHLAAVYASTSWQLTKPLRFLSRVARWFASGVWAWTTLAPGSRPRRTMRRMIIALSRRRQLTLLGKSLLSPFPSATRYVQAIVHSDKEQQVYSAQRPVPSSPGAAAELSPRARRIYNDLKSTITISSRSI
ncbi:MAG TPA: FkbM family methyltransferase [Rhizobiaceae bacterium]|nr:FkbM family methyltransferase [Rhizobiaceae bacterium]